MTSFGKWLGKENGKQMLVGVFNDCTMEQAKNAVVTYCLIFGIEVDSNDWDELMNWIWVFYNSWFDDYEDMDGYMAKDLV